MPRAWYISIFELPHEKCLKRRLSIEIIASRNAKLIVFNSTFYCWSQDSPSVKKTSFSMSFGLKDILSNLSIFFLQAEKRMHLLHSVALSPHWITKVFWLLISLCFCYVIVVKLKVLTTPLMITFMVEYIDMK